MTTGSEGSQGSRERAEQLYAEFLAKRLGGEDVDLESLIASHADIERELRSLDQNCEKLLGRLGQVRRAETLSERIESQYGPGIDPTIELDAEGEKEADATSEILKRLAQREGAYGRYRLKGEIARGGMGAILRVWDEDLRRNLAMKVILGKGEDKASGLTPPVDPRVLSRFLEEAQVTGQLDHPGIVPVHELGLDAEGRVYFTMQLVRGRDFKKILELVASGHEDWNLTRALGVLLKVCEAMSYAHDKGVVHRDLKPANVMVGKYGEVYVMDWGLARVEGREDSRDLRPEPATVASLSEVRTDRKESRESDADSPILTMDGTVVGTPAFMPPEQARGQLARVDQRSDVYSVGAMLYQLLTGDVPFVPSGAKVSPRTLLMRVMEGPPKTVHELAPVSVPAELEAICEKAMARDQEHRYPDMGALAADLRAYLEGRVVEAYQTGAVAEFKKWVGRNKSLAASLAAAVLLLVVGLAAALYLRREAQANFTLAEMRREDLERLNENLALQTRTAEAAAAAEKARADEVLRLSALQDYDELIGRVDGLWPAHAEMIPAYGEWLDEARALVTVLDEHRAMLEELRRDAVQQSGEEREAERRSHPSFPRLEALSAVIASRRDGEAGLSQSAEELAALEAEIEALEVRVSERRTWLFPETEKGREARWWHANLSKLIESLEGLEDEATGLLSKSGDAVSAEHGWSVPRRVAFAERLRDGLAAGGQWADRWTEAAAAIGEHPGYGGLELLPQGGLVPIGPDPSSGLWEFWHVATGAEPVRGEDGKLVLTEETGVVLVLIPAGSFWMGASAAPDAERNHDPQALSNEGPVHEVELSAYLLSKYELTQGQWSRFTGWNPSYNHPPGGLAPSLLHPLEQVSWLDSMRELPRMGLALPIEAQWENGCRAGTGTPWWTGAEHESLREENAANLADQAAARTGEMWAAIQDWPDLDDGFVVHAPVGTYAANTWGLHEVHGNVWEWCLDAYDSGFYSRSEKTDPWAALEGATRRVNRGGSYDGPAAYARSSARSLDTPSFADRDLGVRPARAIEP